MGIGRKNKKSHTWKDKEVIKALTLSPVPLTATQIMNKIDCLTYQSFLFYSLKKLYKSGIINFNKTNKTYTMVD